MKTIHSELPDQCMVRPIQPVAFPLEVIKVLLSCQARSCLLVQIFSVCMQSSFPFHILDCCLILLVVVRFGLRGNFCESSNQLVQVTNKVPATSGVQGTVGQGLWPCQEAEDLPELLGLQRDGAIKVRRHHALEIPSRDPVLSTNTVQAASVSWGERERENGSKTTHANAPKSE